MSVLAKCKGFKCEYDESFEMVQDEEVMNLDILWYGVEIEIDNEDMIVLRYKKGMTDQDNNEHIKIVIDVEKVKASSNVRKRWLKRFYKHSSPPSFPYFHQVKEQFKNDYKTYLIQKRMYLLKKSSDKRYGEDQYNKNMIWTFLTPPNVDVTKHILNDLFTHIYNKDEHEQRS